MLKLETLTYVEKLQYTYYPNGEICFIPKNSYDILNNIDNIKVIKYVYEKEKLYEDLWLLQVLQSKKRELYLEFCPFLQQDKPVDQGLNYNAIKNLINPKKWKKVTIVAPHTIPFKKKLNVISIDTVGCYWENEMNIFPDKNARSHFNTISTHTKDNIICVFNKQRISNTVEIFSMEWNNQKIDINNIPVYDLETTYNFFDDILLGGTSILKCIEYMKLPKEAKIQIYVYHDFHKHCSELFNKNFKDYPNVKVVQIKV